MNRMSLRNLFHTILLLVTVTIVSACDSSNMFLGGKNRKERPSDGDKDTPSVTTFDENEASQSIERNDLISAIEKALDEDLTKNGRVLQEVGNVTIIDYFTNALEAAPNDPVTIMGYTFENLRQKIAKHQATVEQMQSKYETIGEYWNSLGIFSSSDIDVPQIEAGLESAEKILAKDHAVPTTQQKDAVEVEQDDLGKCVLNGAMNFVGCAAGVVECLATLGLACAIGVTSCGTETNPECANKREQSDLNSTTSS